MADFTIDETVDITDVVCPMTFVKAKVAMEELEPLFLYMSHTPHILENPALITTLIHSFSSYYTHSLYIINHPTYFDLYIYTVVPII